ncbi:hypothetical protein ACOSQ3_005184 [Xanthoceras sorbifolium]
MCQGAPHTLNRIKDDAAAAFAASQPSIDTAQSSLDNSGDKQLEVHQSDSEGAAIDKMEEIEQSREAARSTGAGDGLPHSDVMHISINLVETVANPPSQHVAIALDRMESSSLNLESTEVALKNARKSNSIVKPVLKIEKKKRAL